MFHRGFTECSAGDQRFHKSQVLEAKQKTDGGVQSRLKERLDQQITEKNVSRDNERDSVSLSCQAQFEMSDFLVY